MLKNNTITGKKRKKIKTETLENDGNKFFVDKQSLSINIQRIFVNSWETKLKVGDEIKFIKPESFEKYNQEFGNIPTPKRIGMSWSMIHRELWGKNIRYNKLKKEIDYNKTGIIIEVNFKNEDGTGKYDWSQNTIKVRCPKKVNCESSEFYTQTYIEIYFEIPLIKNLVDIDGIGYETYCGKDDSLGAKLNYAENYRRKNKYVDSFEFNEFKVLISNSRKLRKLDLSKIVLVEGAGFFIDN
tara:strand:- start:243 stop:965 length:723 start_codon:yes stop_codon:yes gene_type:complete